MLALTVYVGTCLPGERLPPASCSASITRYRNHRYRIFSCRKASTRLIEKSAGKQTPERYSLPSFSSRILIPGRVLLLAACCCYCRPASSPRVIYHTKLTQPATCYPSDRRLSLSTSYNCNHPNSLPTRTTPVSSITRSHINLYHLSLLLPPLPPFSPPPPPPQNIPFPHQP